MRDHRASWALLAIAFAMIRHLQFAVPGQYEMVLDVKYLGLDVPGEIESALHEVRVLLDDTASVQTIRQATSDAIALDAIAKGLTVARSDMILPALQKGL